MYYFFSHSRYKTAFVGVLRASHAHSRQIAPLEMYLCLRSLASFSSLLNEDTSFLSNILLLTLELTIFIYLLFCEICNLILNE